MGCGASLPPPPLQEDAPPPQQSKQRVADVIVKKPELDATPAPVRTVEVQLAESEPVPPVSAAPSDAAPQIIPSILEPPSSSEEQVPEPARAVEVVTVIPQPTVAADSPPASGPDEVIIPPEVAAEPAGSGAEASSAVAAASPSHAPASGLYYSSMGLAGGAKCSAFLSACGLSDVDDVIAFLTPDFWIDYKDKLGWNGLCKAAYQGQTAVLQALISRGIKLNTVTKAGQSALYLAALAGHGSAVDALLAAGADVSVGMSPILAACANGQESVVRKLVAAGCDVNTRKDDGSSCLHVAASEGHSEVVSLLLQFGAKRELKNASGLTPLALATMFEHTDVITILSAHHNEE